MNKTSWSFIFLLVTVLTVTAQNRIGIDYYKIGDYDLAKRYLEKEVTQYPDESYYYLGEIAFAQGKIEEAKSYYNKGLNVAPENPFNKIGVAKADFKKNPAESVASLIAISKKYSDNMDVLIAIGYAYLDNGRMEEASEKLTEVKKLDKTDPKVYVLEGDILLSCKNLGSAAGKYDMALYFDSTHTLAYIKGAKIYENSNWQTAIEKLKKLITLQPDYIIAYQYMGKIYTSNGYYPSAIEAFKKYFTMGNYNVEDIVHYATALYFNGQYQEAVQIIKEGLAIAPDHFVLNRLLFYSATNLHDIENGLSFATKFLSLGQKNDNQYLAKDYKMYAKLLKDAKKFDQAILEYQKAISIDSNDTEIYKDMADVMNLKDEYGNAADLYQQYINKKKQDTEAMDYFQLGRYYYSAANIGKATDTLKMNHVQNKETLIQKISNKEEQKDSLRKNGSLFIAMVVPYYLTQANQSFDTVIQRVPTGYTGYLWKARTNSLLDPDSETGLAKPYYEKTIEILLEKKESTPIINSSLIEAYSYLGYYYYLKNDKTNTLLYWNKVLELDPKNTNANAVLKTLK